MILILILTQLAIVGRLDAKRVEVRAEGGVHSGGPLPIDTHL